MNTRVSFSRSRSIVSQRASRRVMHPWISPIAKYLPAILFKKRVYKLFPVKGPQVIDLLADPDVLNRYLQLFCNPDKDPALGRAVELGEDYPGHPDFVLKHFGLVEGVLAGRGV